jgi:hypothetical protein
MARPAEVTVSISTSSQEISGEPPLPDAQLPTITLNGVELPQPSVPSNYPSGVQVVVMNASGDLSDPANIITNQATIVWTDENTSWGDTYRFMWDYVANQLLGSGDPQQQLVFIASYGLDLGMFPTPAATELFLGLGAGGPIQQWITTSQPSESGDWVDYPADYVMIGSSGLGYGLAAEKFDYAGGEGNPVQTTLSVTLQNNPEPPTAT